MEITTRPLFALYVVWHPSNASGDKIAEMIQRHFGRGRHRDVAGVPGLSVIFRNEAALDKSVPLPVDWDEAEMSAVVVLVDSNLTGDRAWVDYVQELSQDAQVGGQGLSRFFPVAMEGEDYKRLFEQQALRWGHWEGANAKREMHLVLDLTNEFSRMLRHRLNMLRRPETAKAPLESHLEKLKLFISHSKRDQDGEPIALDIRDWLHKNTALDSFFDVRDIPVGLAAEEVLLSEIRNSAFIVALHTDSYSSREWCRREVIEAKRHCVPMVVVDCLRDVDRRSIPYMGNVPVIRMSPVRRGRIAKVAEYLLKEVFRTYLWRCRVERFASEHPDALFLAWPPELVSLAALPTSQIDNGSTIVYPEPVLGTDDARLFSEIAPKVRIQTLTEWLEASP